MHEPVEPEASPPPSSGSTPANGRAVIRASLESVFARELAAVAANDGGPRPAGWRMSPRAVRTFILGSDGALLPHTWEGAAVGTSITRKFFGDDPMVERAIITLAGNRGLLLVGEPGTAKTMLSELLSAAISGSSTNTIQGTAGTTEDQIKYGWNYALLLAEGPSVRAMVPAPLYVGMRDGTITRFEEITRCPPEIQDTLVGVLSDKVLVIPELEGEQRVLFARPGFNVVATANVRDRGVHEMSSALKRRFNFETVHPIRDVDLEVRLVLEQTEQMLKEAGAPLEVRPEVIDVLVRTFHELREGKSAEGKPLERPSSAMSTAEAVSVGLAAGLDAWYYDDRQRLGAAHVVRHLAGTITKDNADDLKRLRHYFDTVVRERSQGEGEWRDYYRARPGLEA